MAAACILTFLAIGGVLVGVAFGQSRLYSNYLAAAGGGLLFGVSLFWLLPEIASNSGWLAAFLMPGVAFLGLALAERFFVHSGIADGRLALAPVLAATAAHSFLDGWSIRLLETFHVAGITAPLGLALHKMPEGAAIGWVARRTLHSPVKAAAAALSVELVTLLGAYAEPQANRSGFAIFGSWWTSAVIAVVSGSFLFLALHAVLPHRKRASVIIVFLATLFIVAAIGLVRSGIA